MQLLTLPAALLALFWGLAFALFLHRTRIGRWLRHKRTWLTVVIGIGVDLAILRLIIPCQYVTAALVIIALSAIGIIAFAIGDELAEDQELEHINAQPITDEHDQQP